MTHPAPAHTVYIQTKSEWPKKPLRDVPPRPFPSGTSVSCSPLAHHVSEHFSLDLVWTTTTHCAVSTAHVYWCSGKAGRVHTLNFLFLFSPTLPPPPPPLQGGLHRFSSLYEGTTTESCLVGGSRMLGKASFRPVALKKNFSSSCRWCGTSAAVINATKEI